MRRYREWVGRDITDVFNRYVQTRFEGKMSDAERGASYCLDILSLLAVFVFKPTDYSKKDGADAVTLMPVLMKYLERTHPREESLFLRIFVLTATIRASRSLP